LGFTLGNGTIIANTSSNPINITGLSDNTNHDIYVRAICGVNDTSIWAGPLTFLTPCSPPVAPWIDDVETHSPSTSFSFSECWTSSPTIPFSYDWNIGESTTNNTGPAAPFSGTNYFYTDPGSNGDTAFLNMPIINASALTTHVW